jgi:hypothetical protein
MRKLLAGLVVLLVLVLSDFDGGLLRGAASTALPRLSASSSVSSAAGLSQSSRSRAVSTSPRGGRGSSSASSSSLSVDVCAYRVVVLKENPVMFGEVQEFLVAGFKELGFNTSYLTPDECNGEGDSAGLAHPPCQDERVLGVSTTLCTTSMIKSIPARPLWVNLEVLQPELKIWARKCLETGYAEALWSSGPVWDYLHDNIRFTKEKGWASHEPLYLPLRYYKGIVHTDLRYGDWGAPTADVVFVGALFNSPRRQGIIDELRRRGAKVDVLEEVFGPAREARVRAAKVALNVHYYPRNFETVRLFWLLSLGSFVVAEGDPAMHAAVMKEYEGGLVLAPHDKLVDTVMAYLDKPAERRKVADAGYDFIRATAPGEVLRPLVEQSLPRECGW